jgi:UDP-galactopyranose mutase
VRTGGDFRELKDHWQDLADQLIYTGPIDVYFDHRFGKLPYRSLRFDHKTLEQERFQPTGTVNYPSPDVPYTRISEYKHLTGQDAPVTTVTYEYPSAEGDPYYPIPRAENQALFKRYEALGDATEGVTFVGRLATYRYYNMDQIVGQALATFKKLDARRARERARPSAVAAE